MSVTFPYPGGKVMLRSWIMSHMPKDSMRCYCEPFAGRAGVFWKLAKVDGWFRLYWLNDIQTGQFFRDLACFNDSELPPFGVFITREDYKRWWMESSRVARLMEPFICFAGAGYGHGSRAASHGRDVKKIDAYLNKLKEARRFILNRRVIVTEVDYENVFSRLGSRDFAYVDPPYKGATPLAYNTRDFDFDRLVYVLSRAKCRWLLSEYTDHGVGKLVGERSVVMRSCSTRQSTDFRIEKLWSNFD